MINVENINVFNLDGAIHGMRNPMNSWDKSDSYFGCKKKPNIFVERNSMCDVDCTFGDMKRVCLHYHRNFYIGENDLNLAQKLIESGTDHSKFMRQIFVSMDITAPLYLWKEISTYKVATTANSTSTMHKLATTPITKECFSFDNLEKEIDVYMVTHGGEASISFCDYVEDIVTMCETLRRKFIETKDEKYWRMLVQLLPESWNQTRTWTANYAVLRNIYFARKNHKLQEWRDFCKVIEGLPYGKELICYE